VGEFCGENKETMASQLDCDVLVFTAGFLNNVIFNKTLDLENCCCLIIDEIHHAKSGHQFARLIEDYYVNAEPKYRPRIVGCKFFFFHISICKNNNYLYMLLSTFKK
jgi:ERCC4-related helicase